MEFWSQRLPVPIPQSDRQRFAVLSSAVATLLLLLFVQAVVLPLLPPRPLDPFWQLSLIAALSSNGVLALLAVWLVNLGATLDPTADWLQRRQRRLASRCRWMVLAYLLLVPLQGWVGWQVLQSQQAGAPRAPLMAIQALSPEVAIVAGRMAPQQHRSALPVPARGVAGVDPLALVRDSLRVVLLSMGLALAFAAAAQRPGRMLSLRQEWRWAIAAMQDWAWAGLDSWLESEPPPPPPPPSLGQLPRQPRLKERRHGAGTAVPPPPPTGLSAPLGRRIIDAAYFEELAGGQLEPPLAVASEPALGDSLASDRPAAAIIRVPLPPAPPAPTALRPLPLPAVPWGNKAIDAEYFEELAGGQLEPPLAAASEPALGDSLASGGPAAAIIRVPLPPAPPAPTALRPLPLPAVPWGSKAIDAEYFEELAGGQLEPPLAAPPPPEPPAPVPLP